MADPTKSPQPVSTGVLSVAVLAGAVVTIGAAVVSYTHMHELAVSAGEGWLAWIDPALVDGMVVFASTLLYAQHRLGQRAHWLVLPAIILGVAASLGANILSREPDLVDAKALGVIVRAVPPLALAIVGHLAWQLLGLRTRPVPPPVDPPTIGQQVNIATMNVGSQDASREAIQEAPVPRPDAIPAPSRELLPSPPRPARRTAPRKGKVTVPDHEWMPFLKHLRDTLDAQGRDLTPNALKDASRRDGMAPHSLGHDRASRLIEMFEQGVSS